MTNFPAYKTTKVADLIPYARNSRTHSEMQVAKIAASIKEFGFLNPIIVDGENGIIAGHGRVLAAQKLGLESLPVIEASHLTDAQRRAYVIADNKLALDAGWDNEMLRVELKDLGESDFDLTLTGFTLDEVDGLQFDSESDAEMPDLKQGDNGPLQKMTFTLHDDQASEVAAAIEKAKKMGPFIDSENENQNGNAISRICELFNGIS